MASVKPSVKVVKTIPFKGGSRLVSNRYFFSGGVPPDDTHWHTLFDNIVAAEKLIYTGFETITEVLGYLAGSDVAVSTKVYATAGTHALGANDYGMPGECAAIARWSTAARSTKNHPIFIFKYWHIALGDRTAAGDLLSSTQRTLMQTYAAAWITGFSDGGAVTAKLSSPAGHDATGSEVGEYVTHRDFPYTSSV